MLDLFLFLGKSAKTQCDDPAEIDTGVSAAACVVVALVLLCLLLLLVLW